jgi:hypothetical protein
MIEDEVGSAQVHLLETLQGMEEEMADYPLLLQKTKQEWEATFGTPKHLRTDRGPAL